MKVMGVIVYMCGVLPIVMFIGLVSILIAVDILTIISIIFYITTGMGKTDEYIDRLMSMVELIMDGLMNIPGRILK
jgi:hypothetical protein